MEGQPPADGEDVRFSGDGSGYISMLDRARSVGVLDFIFTADVPAPSQVVDLNGYELSASVFEVGRDPAKNSAITTAALTTVLQNGMLALAEDGEFLIGCRDTFRVNGAAAFTAGSGLTLKAGTLSKLWVGHISNSSCADAVTDLSTLTEPSQLVWMNGEEAVPGVLCVDSFQIGDDLEIDRLTGSASFSIGTALKELRVASEFIVGGGMTSELTLPGGCCLPNRIGRRSCNDDFKCGRRKS